MHSQDSYAMKLQKTFIVKPNMNCNLRCRYCYEFNKNGDCYNNSLLSIDEISSFIYRVSKLFPDSRILWLLHGGEPLINGGSFLEEFITRVRQARDSSGVDFQLALQTNGTLITEDIVKILEGNIDLLSERVVSVSIDGPQLVNDQVRVTMRVTRAAAAIWTILVPMSKVVIA